MTDIISSPQNPRIKAVAELRESRARRASGRIVIDGIREIRRALDAGVEIDETFVCDELMSRPETRTLLTRLRGLDAAVISVSRRAFEKISYGDREEGIVLVARRPEPVLDAITRRAAPALIAVIDGLEKPGNIGAILRTADAAGASGVIVNNSASDPYGPNAIRASTGAIFTVPLVESARDATRDWLQTNHIQIVTASPHAKRDYTEIDLAQATAVVLGSEATGLTDDWDGPAVAARIPMHGRADSLNVSVTAALFLYEALRQRHRKRES